MKNLGREISIGKGLKVLALEEGLDDYLRKEIGRILNCNWPVITVTKELSLKEKDLDRTFAREVNVFSPPGQGLIDLRLNMSLLGPVYLGQILELSPGQKDLLSLAFTIADQRGLYLYDIKDLRSFLVYLGDKKDFFERSYGSISRAGLSAIIKKLVQLERDYGDIFTDPSLDLNDLEGDLYIFDLGFLGARASLKSALAFWLVTESFELDRPLAIFIEDDLDLFKSLDKKIQADLLHLLNTKKLSLYLVYDRLKKVDRRLLDQADLVVTDQKPAGGKYEKPLDLDENYVFQLAREEINTSGLREKYARREDRFSAYEMLMEREVEEEETYSKKNQPGRRTDNSFDRFTKNVASQMGREIGRIISRTLFGNIRR